MPCLIIDPQQGLIRCYLGGQFVAEHEGTTLQYIHQDNLNSTGLVTVGVLALNQRHKPGAGGGGGIVNEGRFIHQDSSVSSGIIPLDTIPIQV